MINTLEKTETQYKLYSRDYKKDNTLVELPGCNFGSADFGIIAGPCSVENETQVFKTAEFLLSHGISMFRAGAFKPRTSPYSFQGLGQKALQILRKLKQDTGISIITEAMDVITIDDVAEVVDVVQIGSRSMQNFPLLKKAGQLNKPVLLKRGFSATLEELLLSAEYILAEGNSQVILCERGVRTFDSHSRNMLDISAIPVLKEMTHLPVIIDPSHASGDRSKILPLSRAALAVGADGLIIEVHPDPDNALSDGPQSMDFPGFEYLLADLKNICVPLNRNCRVG